jgi:hypothetical protein
MSGSSVSSRYGSRKFIIALVALGLGTWMRFRGVLSDESTLTLMVTAVLGYTGGNVGSTWVGGKRPE